MAKPSGGKVERISRSDGEARFRTAKLYLQTAQLVSQEVADEAPNVATGNAVLAGIAAADGIGASTGQGRWRGSDHRAAADHLERVTGDKKLGKMLRDLVDLKDAGHYGMSSVSAANAKRALRLAAALVDEAGRRLK